jgi:acyl-ACP thioesterase
MQDIWHETVTVRFGNIDQSDRLTLCSVFSFFQEAAICHAAALGVGREDFARTGQVWIISRLSLFVKRRPGYGEILKVNTWPRGREKLFAYRDYEIRDEKDQAVVRGRAAWLVLDVEKRRPVRLEAFLESLPSNAGLDAFPAGPAALGQKEGLIKNLERTAQYSDIDYFGHMNNARYIQWIQDASSIDILTNADQIRLDINYLSEVMPGEIMEIWAAPINDAGQEAPGCPADYPGKPGPGFSYEGRKPGSNNTEFKTAFRAELRT